jgi:Amino acid permease.
MSILLNGALGFGFLIAVLFSMGDLQAALATPTGYPIIEIFYQATGSKKAATAMVCGLVASAVFSTLGLMASASRTTWAFARDNGLPLSEHIAHVSRIICPVNGNIIL